MIKDYDCAMGRYEDAYGNTIEGYTGKIKSVIFRGCNNHIIIGDKVTGVQNLTFDLTANAYIEIERENRINAENRFVTRGFNGKSEVIVKRNCRLTNVCIDYIIVSILHLFTLVKNVPLKVILNYMQILERKS